MNWASRISLGCDDDSLNFLVIELSKWRLGSAGRGFYKSLINFDHFLSCWLQGIRIAPRRPPEPRSTHLHVACTLKIEYSISESTAFTFTYDLQ